MDGIQDHMTMIETANREGRCSQLSLGILMLINSMRDY
jgi:hypothetical protein